MPDDFTDLQPLENFTEDHPGFTKKRLLWLRHRSKPVRRINKETGQVQILRPLPYGDAFRKVGGKIYILPRVFFSIVERENGRSDDAS